MSKPTDHRGRKLRPIFAALLPTRCPYCGELVFDFEPWDLDHAVPHALGGATTLGNLRPAHRSCNREHGRFVAAARRRARDPFAVALDNRSCSDKIVFSGRFSLADGLRSRSLSPSADLARSCTIAPSRDW